MEWMLKLVDVAMSQTDHQLSAYESLESKAIATLAFDGALVGALVIAPDHQADLRVVAFIFGGVSIAAVIAALWIRRMYDGPKLSEFYACTLTKSDSDAAASLLASFGESSLANAAPLARKGLFWTIGALLLGLSVTAGMLSILIMRS